MNPAQGGTNTQTGGIDIRNYLPNTPITSISSIINFVIPMITLLAALFFLGMLFYAAFTWITAGSNAENVAKAWKIITWAVIGLIVVSLSYLLVKILGIVLGTQALPF